MTRVLVGMGGLMRIGALMMIGGQKVPTGAGGLSRRRRKVCGSLRTSRHGWKHASRITCTRLRRHDALCGCDHVWDIVTMARCEIYVY